MKVKLQQVLEFEMTPQQLANIFCEMNDREQADFFNGIGKNAKSWLQPLESQLFAIRHCPDLNEDGKRVLTAISQMFGTHDVDMLLDACRTVVAGYETDGFEVMGERDHVFNKVCKHAIEKSTEPW